MDKVRYLMRTLPALLVLLVLGIVWQGPSADTRVGAAPAVQATAAPPIQATQVGPPPAMSPGATGTVQAPEAITATAAVPTGPVPTTPPSVMDTPTPRPSPIITPEPAAPEGEEEQEVSEHPETIDQPDEAADRTGALISGVAVLVGALGLALFLRRN